MGNKVTIKTIAERCNVSQVTVSRVIANNPNVSQKTRNQVLTAMRDMGYRSAKSELPDESTAGRYVLLMTEDITRNSTGILQCIAGYLKERGYLSLFCETGHQAAYVREYYDSLISSNMILGVVAISIQGARANLSDIAEHYRDIPMVVVHWCEAWSKVDSVIIDSYHSAYSAVRMLAKMGHVHIALLNSPPDCSGSYEERKGFLAAMEECGLTTDKRYIFSTNLKKSDSVIIAKKLATTMMEVTAVMTATKELAIGLINELEALGRRVPEDVSVIAFDIVDDSFQDKSLTRVGAKFSEAGIAAAKLILERIIEQRENHGRSPTVKKVVLEPQVFQGSTVQPPKNEKGHN